MYVMRSPGVEVQAMNKSRVGLDVIELDRVDVIEYRVGTGPYLAGLNLKPHQAMGSGQAQLTGS